jgi:hypothetical protein
LLAPPLAAALLLAWQERAPVWKRAALLGSYGLLLLAHIALWFPWGKAVTNLGPQPLGALVFLGYLVAEALQDFRRPPALAVSRQAA